MNLEGCTALVTGGAVRIGREICRELVLRGCNVVVHYNNSREQAAELEAELALQGGKVYTAQGPLTTQAECEQVLDAAWVVAGGLDILVNNAAIFAKQSLLNAGESDFETMWRVNCLAPIMLARAFALERADARGGVVINLLDRRVAGDEAGCLPYLLAKKALAAFTRSAALELAPLTRINAVAPGAILPPPSSAAPVRDLAGHVPLERQCTPGDVAGAVAFLAEADALTGQTVFVDGGQHLL